MKKAASFTKLCDEDGLADALSKAFRTETALGRRVASFADLADAADATKHVVVRLRSPYGSKDVTPNVTPGNSNHGGGIWKMMMSPPPTVPETDDLSDSMWVWKTEPVDEATGLTSDDMWAWETPAQQLPKDKEDVLWDWSHGRDVPGSLELHVDSDDLWAWHAAEATDEEDTDEEDKTEVGCPAAVDKPAKVLAPEDMWTWVTEAADEAGPTTTHDLWTWMTPQSKCPTEPQDLLWDWSRFRKQPPLEARVDSDAMWVGN
jgi:hypothetical protein